MADIDLQEKNTSSGKGWLWALVLLAAAAVVLFFLFNGEGDDGEVGAGLEVDAVDWDPDQDDSEGESAEAQNSANQANSAAENNESGLPIASIMGDPNSWSGRTVSGDVNVGAVPTDRGFWVESGSGERAFVIVDPENEESVAHVQQGQQMRISSATVHRSASNLTGSLEEASRDVLSGQNAFLVVDPEDFEIL